MTAILNFFSDWKQLKNDTLSGLTVALALLPEAVAIWMPLNNLVVIALLKIRLSRVI